MNGEDRRLSQKNRDMFCSELEIQPAGMFNVSTFNLNICMVYIGGSSIKVDFFMRSFMLRSTTKYFYIALFFFLLSSYFLTSCVWLGLCVVHLFPPQGHVGCLAWVEPLSHST